MQENISSSLKKRNYLIVSGSERSSSSGYALALLMVFLASSLLIATSMSLILSTNGTSYIANSASSAACDQIANAAFDAAQTDILSKLSNATTVDTSYRYPNSGTNSVSIPAYPSSGSTIFAGTYYVTASKVRGYTYILNATIAVNGTKKTVSKLIQLSSAPPFYHGALLVYSLRKIVPSYAGNAVNVTCNNHIGGGITANIGFDSKGNLDLSALRSCLSARLPGDVVTPVLAYGLRKIVSSYNGYALKIRRSSDGNTQDIGFDSLGNLDTAALKSWVLTSSAYIDTWYDQSGNGKNMTQITPGNQPMIVSNGTLQTINNLPTVYFDGSNDYMANTGLGGSLITGSAATAVTVAQNTSATSNSSDFTALHRSSCSTYSWDCTGAWASLGMIDPTTSEGIGTYYAQNHSGNYVNSGSILGTTPFVGSALLNGTAMNIYLYNSTAYSGSAASSITVSLSPDQAYLGTEGQGSGVSSYRYKGNLSEAVYYNSALSTSNRNEIERNSGLYYGIPYFNDGFVNTWYDQSGNGYNATQSTSSYKPQVVFVGSLASGNGKLSPGIYFDGIDNYLSTSSSSAWPSGNSARTMNAVFQPTKATWYVLFGWGTKSTGNYSSLMDGSSNSLKLWGYNQDLESNFTPSVNNAHSATVVFTGASNSIYIDGSLKGTRTYSLNTTSNTALIIGTDSTSGTYHQGSEAEILVYPSALSSSQLTALTSNQSSYYGQ